MTTITINHDDGPEEAFGLAEMLLNQFGVKYTVEDGDGFMRITYEEPRP